MPNDMSQKEVHESLEDAVDLDVWERRNNEADQRDFKKSFYGGGRTRRINSGAAFKVVQSDRRAS